MDLLGLNNVHVETKMRSFSALPPEKKCKNVFNLSKKKKVSRVQKNLLCFEAFHLKKLFRKFVVIDDPFHAQGHREPNVGPEIAQLLSTILVFDSTSKLKCHLFCYDIDLFPRGVSDRIFQ